MPTATIPDTWQVFLPSGGYNGVTTWSTYRTFYGAVDFTCTDISVSDGRRWHKANMTIWLVDSGGGVWATNSLTKYWGQDASMRIGSVMPGRSLRLRTSVTCYNNGGGQTGPAGTWGGVLSWG